MPDVDASGTSGRQKPSKERVKEELERILTQKEKLLEEERKHREERAQHMQEREESARKDAVKEEREVLEGRERRDAWRKELLTKRRQDEERRHKRAEEARKEEERRKKAAEKEKKRQQYMEDLRARAILRKRKEHLESLALEEERSLRKLDEELTRRLHDAEATLCQNLAYLERGAKTKAQSIKRNAEIARKRAEDKHTQELRRSGDRQVAQRYSTMELLGVERQCENLLRDLEVETEKLRQEAQHHSRDEEQRIRSDIALHRKEVTERIARAREGGMERKNGG